MLLIRFWFWLLWQLHSFNIQLDFALSFTVSFLFDLYNFLFDLYNFLIFNNRFSNILTFPFVLHIKLFATFLTFTPVPFPAVIAFRIQTHKHFLALEAFYSRLFEDKEGLAFEKRTPFWVIELYLVRWKYFRMFFVRRFLGVAVFIIY